MKKIAFVAIVLVGVAVVMAQVPSQMFNRHTAREFKANSGWTVVNVGGLGQTFVQMRYSGIATTDSLYVTWFYGDSVSGKRLTFGASDSSSWLNLPVFSTNDSLRIRTRTDDSIWVRLRIYK